jgi:Lipopolysaccharide-assembly
MRSLLFQNLKFPLLASLLAFSFSSCGYHTAASDDKTSISIPYVEGDAQGQFTAELIRQITNSNHYDFVKNDGDLVLKVVLEGDKSDIIGFQYDETPKKGEIEKNLMANENRRSLTAQVTLTDACTEKVIVGPVNITASTDYDYIDVNSLKEVSLINEQGKPERTISFSLGQLDSIEGAQDAALTPVYRLLAQKVALTLNRATMLSDD